MRPSLRQLEYFVALAEEGSFGRAAQALSISQPALSQQIRELEERLGVALVDRVPRKIRLTSAGEKTLVEAREILRRTQDLQDIARTVQGDVVGEVTLGSISTASPYVVAPALARLRERHPSLQVTVHDSELMALERLLRRGRIDVLLRSLMDRARGTEQRPLWREPFVVLAPAESRIGESEAPVSPSELEGEALLLLDEAHCFRGQALAVCELVGAHPQSGIHATSIATLVEMVRRGMGLTLLPALAIDERLVADPAVRLRAFREPVPARLMGLVWRSSSHRVLEFESLAEVLVAAARESNPAREAGLEAV